ncbi:MAG: insulinase family protein [Saprospiraceae bacterium]
MFELNKVTKKEWNLQFVPNDHMGVKMYTLSNGLKLFLSVNKDEPRIFTNIAVRAGSKYDPDDCTGLAHYLEHMMFKGSSKIGALDWEKEKVMLEQISDLYEEHKQETDSEKRTEIYKKIDQISNEAAKLVAANEYDKLSSALGAKSTNAYTWVEQTVYVNDIPANEIERWMKLEAERFSMVALRLFHTELETVYEEFNISQDKDIRKALVALNKALFPTHPYGTHTTLGEGEHLKNPSHKSIQQFFSNYYVPNNIGIVLAGDFDENKVVELAEKYWGTLVQKTIPTFHFENQDIFDSTQKREVLGQESEMVLMGWRLPKAADESSVITELVGSMLFNGQAGLIDIALNNQQKVLKCQVWAQLHEDYSILMAYAQPRQGQSLEEVENLILEQIDNLSNGNYPDWLLSAVLTNLKLNEIKYLEKNETRTAAITSAFVMGMEWKDYCSRFERMEKADKKVISEFCKKHLKSNAIVYKRNGTDENVLKVAKPAITPIELNRDDLSAFTQDFLKESTAPLSPEFINFSEQIETVQVQNGLTLKRIAGNIPGFFELHYIFEMGKLSDRELGIAISMLPYLGTDQYDSMQLQQEFFKLGLYFKVSCNDDRTYISLSGLEENLEKGIVLLEHILSSAQTDNSALQNIIEDVIKTFENNKKNREYILRNAMISYAKFGVSSPFLKDLSEAELKALQADKLLQIVKELPQYEHDILYVGNHSLKEISGIINQHHLVNPILKEVKLPNYFKELETDRKVFFVDFPMVQVDIMFLSKGNLGFQLQEYLMAEMYNDYFGYGLSSIFFQEIRESRALGYAASAVYSSPSKNDRSHFLQAYVGTQPDKIHDALPAIQSILDTMPISEHQIEQTKTSILKRIESERIHGSQIYWKYLSNKSRGYEHDTREDLYTMVKNFKSEQLKAFHQKYIEKRNYSILILGNKENIDLEYLKNWGEVVELTVNDIFKS